MSVAANTRIILSFENKLQEIEFFLERIEAEWNATLMELNQQGQLRDTGNLERINYYFSGFSNSLQSIQDALHSVTGTAHWGAFSTIKYYPFIKHSRNAISHDGLWLISTFTNGRYYVEHAGGQIIRYDENGKQVTIECPSDDIVTVCREFYSGLLNVVSSIISQNMDSFTVTKPEFAAMAEASILQSHAIPKFVKMMHLNNPSCLSDAFTAADGFNAVALLERINVMLERLAIGSR
jgi:hypothetical protein